MYYMCWVVGIIDRATGRCWLEIVARCCAAILERMITARVRPGSIIVTDAWGGYSNVVTTMYDHQVVALRPWGQSSP